MLTQGITEIMTGMEHWFRDNMPFEIEIRGECRCEGFRPTDSTVDTHTVGFHVGYDAKFKRIVLIRKRECPMTTSWSSGRQATSLWRITCSKKWEVVQTILLE